jgi:hypothetical protein
LLKVNRHSHKKKGGQNEKITYGYPFGHSALFYFWMPGQGDNGRA